VRCCWHVWRERKTRRLYVGGENGLDRFVLYPKQCAACFLADA
jgi:hypothetical protein